MTNDATPRTVTISWSGRLYQGTGGPTLSAPTSQSGISLTVGQIWSKDLGTLQYDAGEGGTQVPNPTSSYTSVVRAITSVSVSWSGGSVSTSANPTNTPGQATKSYIVKYAYWCVGSGVGDPPAN